MMAFIARIMQNPEFMHQLISQHETSKGLERRCHIGQVSEADSMGTSSSLEQGSQAAFEPQEPVESLVYGVPSHLESSSVDTKGVEVQQGACSDGSGRLRSSPAESKMMSFGRIFCMKGDLVRRLATQLVKM
jgi:heat shock transcription factor, other eukaryote